MVSSLKKHTISNALIYKISGKKAIRDTTKYKAWLFTRKTKYISNLNPIVIGGCPRSGTTLARALIGIHSDVASSQKEYNVLMSLKYQNAIKNVFGFSQDEYNTLKNKNKDYIFFAEKILELYMKKEKKQFIAIKHPYHILIIDELFNYFPNMKFIHIIRDGRDASCSLRTHPKRKMVNGKIIPLNTNNPFNWCIIRWVVSINQGKKWRKSNNYIEIKYEDLVNNTIKSMKKIFKFLNLKMVSKDDILEFYKNERKEEHLQNIKVAQPIYKKTIGRWKKDMSKKEKEMFKKMAGELLIELGYEKDFNW